MFQSLLIYVAITTFSWQLAVKYLEKGILTDSH